MTAGDEEPTPAAKEPDSRHYSVDRRIGIGQILTVAALILNVAVVGGGGFFALGTMSNKIDQVTSQISELKRDVGTAIDGIRNELQQTVARLDQRVDSLRDNTTRRPQ